MNNDAFRSLITSTSPRESTNGKTETSLSSSRQAAFGARNRTSIQLAPRNLPGHQSSTSEPPRKKFKSSAAPKGTRLGAGYVDRASLRQGHGAQDEDSQGVLADDKATRLQNLEEQFKLGQIDADHFERLKEQMGIGGDVSSTHLVRGLDWKLLARVKRGEDIENADSDNHDGLQTSNVDGEGADLDEELDRALDKQIDTRRESADVPDAVEEQQTQQVLSRDEILRRFREQRKAPTIQQAAVVLNDKFKKIAPTQKSEKRKFVEAINGRRREVLVITNKDGSTKRKTRWLDPENLTKPEHQPLGMEIPSELAAKQKAMHDAETMEDDNDDIFPDAGHDYDPLAGLGSDSDQSDDEPAGKGVLEKASDLESRNNPVKQRNYFSTSKEDPEQTYTADPTMLAALKRAAQIRQQRAETEIGSEQADVGAKSAAFLAKLKEQERQDAADLDYGFGEHRMGDEDDEAGAIYEDEEGETSKKGGRKRGPKKRKGDKNNVQDVMSALESRSQREPQA